MSGYGIYSGTIGEAEYADGRDQGRAAAESLSGGTYALGAEWIEEATEEARNAVGRRTRAYYLGWLRGFREISR